MRAFDYFQLEERPMVVDREADAAWIWSRGEWREAPELIETVYSATGAQMERDAFVHQFPFAALELLEIPAPARG